MDGLNQMTWTDALWTVLCFL